MKFCLSQSLSFDHLGALMFEKKRATTPTDLFSLSYKFNNIKIKTISEVPINKR